jgi:hypothetical protein
MSGAHDDGKKPKGTVEIIPPKPRKPQVKDMVVK